ncbi:hypothetical protein KKH39_03555 [Patescibacteria group bacterium]|nr:hypothetical protein [Patescibacteria group bacterium]
MFDKIKLIAQADDQILKNLNQTEQELIDLNNEVNIMLSDYDKNSHSFSSFFDFSNPFFLVTLIGLTLLAIGLWFLYLELKNSPGKAKTRPQTEPSKPSQPSPKEEKKDIPPVKKKKSVKIKVVKVK